VSDLPTDTTDVVESAEGEPADAGVATGVYPSQLLRRAIADEWIGGRFKNPLTNVQPASYDLRLGDRAYALRCSFLPDANTLVEDKLAGLSEGEPIDLSKGAILERDRPYLIPLMEELHLPDEVRGRANPKSSTGRLDIFTRVLTDKNYRFDDIRNGYGGKLYIEVVPRSFSVKVYPELSLNQLRLAAGGDARCSDKRIFEIHDSTPLLFGDSGPFSSDDLAVTDGLFLSVDLKHEGLLGYRARKNTSSIDLSRVGEYEVEDFWEAVQPVGGGPRCILDPDDFYLLLSAERVSIPPTLAAEMAAYDPSAGELRTHYAGFFDPGFGFDPIGTTAGARAVLEVRARDVPFMVEHGQRICKLTFEEMLDEPDMLYGEEIGSSYQYQELTLSKHFKKHLHRPGERQLTLAAAAPQAWPRAS
jgi:dCTP deaminase